jgi:hypothetical protein
MKAFQCTSCSAITTEPIQIRAREHFSIGDALVPHDFVELRCTCGGDLDETILCDCGQARPEKDFEECTACLALAMVDDQAELRDFRMRFAGTDILKRIERAMERELSTVVQAGRATA